MNLFQTDDLKWKHFTGSDKFDYPIDYAAALLSARDDGHVDLLYRWAPNAYCHFHRHTGYITSTVLSGELHVIDIDRRTLSRHVLIWLRHVDSLWPRHM